jgi:hypothetical protein
MKEYKTFYKKMQHKLEKAVMAQLGIKVNIEDHLFDINIETAGMNPCSDYATLVSHDGDKTEYSVGVDLDTGDVHQVSTREIKISASIL